MLLMRLTLSLLLAGLLALTAFSPAAEARPPICGMFAYSGPGKEYVDYAEGVSCFAYNTAPLPALAEALLDYGYDVALCEVQVVLTTPIPGIPGAAIACA